MSGRLPGRGEMLDGREWREMQMSDMSYEADAQEEKDVPPPLGPRLPGSRSKGKATRGKRKVDGSGNDAAS